MCGNSFELEVLSKINFQAYYIGIKDRIQTNRAYSPVTPEPDVLTTTQFQVICHEACEFHLVESIPVNLTYNASTKFMTTTDAWLQLIANATREIRIASYYWSLLPNDTQGYADSTAEDGVKVYEALVDAGKRGIVMQITQNAQPNPETTYLQNNGWAHVRSLNFTRLLGSGQ
ncbi:unnamed protein product [Anisakis simplex]|uniref:Probable phospholipase D (inferred by orthology to a C. elegans protein) n=1 Tax=Anisakis simplex TaxID=6269 RepID=A0A0M3J7H8_ANISI|nr:unnamed protein product [Anisakis simplex]